MKTFPKGREEIHQLQKQITTLVNSSSKIASSINFIGKA
jgi:hypothetical protein